jgi:plastocyanin
MKKYLVLFLLVLTTLPTACKQATTQQETQGQILQKNEVFLTAPAIALTITREDCSGIEVAPGTQVMWTNADTVPLTFKMEQLNENDEVVNTETSELKPGATMSKTFPAPATYRYYCSKEMDGYRTIVVK